MSIPTPQSSNPKLLIGLVGVERSGKDTIADYLIANYGFKKYSLAEPLRTIGKLMFGWTNEHLTGPQKDTIDPNTGIKPRDFLIWFGTEVCQFAIYDKFPQLAKAIPPRTIWANMMRQYIAENIGTSSIIVTDIRFVHEAEIFKAAGGVIIHVSRKERETPDQLAKYDIYTLCNGNKYVDYVFDNNNDLETCKRNVDESITILSMTKP